MLSLDLLWNDFIKVKDARYVSPISESYLQTLFCGKPEKKSLGALSYVVQDEFVNK